MVSDFTDYGFKRLWEKIPVTIMCFAFSIGAFVLNISTGNPYYLAGAIVLTICGLASHKIDKENELKHFKSLKPYYEKIDTINVAALPNIAFILSKKPRINYERKYFEGFNDFLFSFYTSSPCCSKCMNLVKVETRLKGFVLICERCEIESKVSSLNKVIDDAVARKRTLLEAIWREWNNDIRQ